MTKQVKVPLRIAFLLLVAGFYEEEKSPYSTIAKNCIRLAKEKGDTNYVPQIALPTYWEVNEWLCGVHGICICYEPMIDMHGRFSSVAIKLSNDVIVTGSTPLESVVNAVNWLFIELPGKRCSQRECVLDMVSKEPASILAKVYKLFNNKGIIKW